MFENKNILPNFVRMNKSVFHSDKLSVKVTKKPLSKKILNRIIVDNEFSLYLSLHLKMRQDTVIKMAKKESDVLRLPEQLDFYRSYGYEDKDLFDVK